MGEEGSLTSSSMIYAINLGLPGGVSGARVQMHQEPVYFVIWPSRRGRLPTRVGEVDGAPVRPSAEPRPPALGMGWWRAQGSESRGAGGFGRTRRYAVRAMLRSGRTGRWWGIYASRAAPRGCRLEASSGSRVKMRTDR